MAATIPLTPPGPRTDASVRLLEWFASHGVDYELTEHTPTVTARETASVEGLDPRRFAKTLAVVTEDGRHALLVLEATDRLDLPRAGRALGSRVRLLAETELETLAPDLPIGTLPPVGELVGLPVYADVALREDPEITFNAGSHSVTATVERAAWERAAGVAWAVLADDDGGPAWARS